MIGLSFSVSVLPGKRDSKLAGVSSQVYKSSHPCQSKVKAPASAHVVPSMLADSLTYGAMDPAGGLAAGLAAATAVASAVPALKSSELHASAASS